MTISEVIGHCEKVADELLRKSDAYKIERKKKKSPYEREYCTLESKRSLACRAEYLQIAEWLKDYKRLLEEKRKDKWIRLAVERPKEGVDVLIAIKHPDGEYKQAVSSLYDYTYWSNFGRDVPLTHWMPLPESPKEVKE